jgi:1,4-alpha-glucan branching enzyme
LTATRQRCQKLIERDSYLKPYESVIRRRLDYAGQVELKLTQGTMDLVDFASGHEYFGLHRQPNGWVFREWAPNATAIYLIGQLTDWKDEEQFLLKRVSSDGVWELHLPEASLNHLDLYRLRVHWPDGYGDRIPTFARRVVQDPDSHIFNAQVWMPSSGFHWRCPDFCRTTENLFIYEAHIGMAQEEARIGTYHEFEKKILPRIIKCGYNTLQLMAIPEHPYYGSFGYHVANFFAASSRFGTPTDLKHLVDAAHLAGLNVIMDLVHSHAVSNEIEGLSRFDGTGYQFFHNGPKGYHEAWGSRCFDYSKHQVLHFLLSNCRYWLDEYRVDGFRFDGITSMLYWDHGLSKAFTAYDDYFDSNVDEDALTYLALANRLIHRLRPDAITIAEDVSGMPGLAAPEEEGGIGFDFRFAMGIPDHWIRLTKDTRDEDWSMGHLWHELTNRRPDEKTISYTESHDQALVGDQTLIFRLIGADMYHHMSQKDTHLSVDRGVALHKLIRLITLAAADSGYLNFMGNEFGHPEWIDFPRQGNDWSYDYARRQWHLSDDINLKYQHLANFDRQMITLAKKKKWLASPDIQMRCLHEQDKVIIFQRASLWFVFNFHPTQSYIDYQFEAPPGLYRIDLDSDAPDFGGHGRIDHHQFHYSQPAPESSPRCHKLSLYLPNRTGMVFQREGSAVLS